MSLENSKVIIYPGIDFAQEYRIDENGHIYSPWRGWKEMSQHINNGYKELYLYLVDGRRKCFKVHRLLMETYSPIENSKELQVNHIDGNKANNNINNLEWCTRSENLKHAFRIGLEQSPKGEKNYFHKLNDQQVKEICTRLQQKEKITKIANDYGVSKGCIYNIKNKKHWKHIVEDYHF